MTDTTTTRTHYFTTLQTIILWTIITIVVFAAGTAALAVVLPIVH